MFRIILITLWIISLLYCFYFGVTAIGTFFKKKEKKTNSKENFFAILIAARNEELVIGNLIKSLKKQNYPDNKYEIYVIINNCTDNTLDVAKKAGASILECTEKTKTKGEVLKYAFNKLTNNKKIDAYAIFDADNVVHSDFLKNMNDTLNNGYTVAQGFRDTKNISDNWLTSSYAILYYMQSLFINESRYKMGKSSFLNGTGFAIKKEVIDKHGFDPKTVTEDIEFTALCALNDEKIAFANDAITYDEQLTNFKSSLGQRKRWSFGAMECLRNYFPMLLKKGIKEKNFECIDVAIFYLSVIFHVMLSLVSIVMFFSVIINYDDFSLLYLIDYIIAFMLSLLVGMLFRVFVLKRNNKSIKDNLGGILLFDLFVFSWIPVNLISIFMKTCSWDQIKHNRNIDIENI